MKPRPITPGLANTRLKSSIVSVMPMENINKAKHAVYALDVINANVFGLMTPTTAARMVQIGNKLAKTSENFLKDSMLTTAPPAARAMTPPRLLEEDVSRTAPNLAEAIFRTDSSAPPARAEATTVDRRIASGANAAVWNPDDNAVIVRDVDLLTLFIRRPHDEVAPRAAWVDKLTDAVVVLAIMIGECFSSKRERTSDDADVKVRRHLRLP